MFGLSLVFYLEIAMLHSMPLTPATAEIPLTTDSHGAVRVGGTRVTLDSIVVAFRAGATAEEIAQQFPAVALADIYQVIAYYLQHASAVDAYLSKRQHDATDLRREIEAKFDPRGLRARLLARQTTSGR